MVAIKVFAHAYVCFDMVSRMNRFVSPTILRCKPLRYVSNRSISGRVAPQRVFVVGVGMTKVSGETRDVTANEMLLTVSESEESLYHS